MMILNALVLFVFCIIRSWATEYEPILHKISSGKSDCNSDELLANFDLNAVAQFGALCNIPPPEVQQTDFLLENNVIPILCMGLYDASLRLCKIAREDVLSFQDIFPPSTDKFSKIFYSLSSLPEFSSSGIFCSSTVKKYAIAESSSNFTELWWQVLNKQFSDEKDCTNICHTNEQNKVHPLCSFIAWANGIYKNYLQNKDEAKVTSVGTGEEEKPPAMQTFDELAEKSSHPVGSLKNESNEVRESDSIPHVVEKMPAPQTKVDGTGLNVTSASSVAVVGTVEQVNTGGDQMLPTNTTKIDVNPTVHQVKPIKKSGKVKGTHHKSKQIVQVPATVKPTEGLKVEPGSVAPEKSILSNDQTESKADSKVNAAVGSDQLAQQGSAKGSEPSVPDTQKAVDQSEPKAPEAGALPKPSEGMVEGDFSLEVTPDEVALDQPIAADKDFQPHYSDEEGEDGDGDDVDIVESNPPVSAVTNTNKTAISKVNPSKTSGASIEQGALEGDKVYGDGEILLEDHFIEAEDSHFFTYFLCMGVLTIMAYLAFHNKKKLIALAVEGRRSKGGRRRPNSSHYSKLDCSLEEALVSNTTASVTHVLY